MNSRKVFAELLIAEAPACHITLISANGLSEQEAQIIQLEVDKKLASMMPIHIQLGNYCMVGSRGEVPAYQCKAYQPWIHKMLCEMYKKYWKPERCKRCYPELLMHVTVDTPEKLDQIEEIFRVSPDHSFASSRYNVGSRSTGIVQRHQPALPTEQDFARALPFPLIPQRTHSPPYNPELHRQPPVQASAPPASDHALPLTTTPTTWMCGSCNKVNSMSIKECSRPGCTQWRPMPKRNGDWSCCGEMQFASRSNCRRCGNPKRIK